MNCGNIFLADMENGRFAALDDFAHENGHQLARVSAALKIRMSADRADFGVAGQMQPFASHRYQTLGSPDAQVLAQFASARAKGPWLGEFGERDHIRHICW